MGRVGYQHPLGLVRGRLVQLVTLQHHLPVAIVARLDPPQRLLAELRRQMFPPEVARLVDM